jgi:hypothetical protein
MVVFPGALDALSCAIAMQQAVERHNQSATEAMRQYTLRLYRSSNGERALAGRGRRRAGVRTGERPDSGAEVPFAARRHVLRSVAGEWRPSRQPITAVEEGDHSRRAIPPLLPLP